MVMGYEISLLYHIGKCLTRATGEGSVSRAIQLYHIGKCLTRATTEPSSLRTT